jgi:5-methylcytosine-specific restriction enzyme A
MHITYYCSHANCYKKVSKKGYCQKHQKKRYDRHSDKRYKQENKEAHNERSRFYGSKRWKKVRLLKLMQDPICEHCKAVSIITLAVDVHHKKNRIDYPELTFDLDNLEALCKAHHTLESNKERSNR